MSFVLTRREGAGFVLKRMFRTLYMLFYMFQYKCTHHGKLTCVLFYMFQYLYKCTHHGKLTCVRPCVTTDCASTNHMNRIRSTLTRLILS